MSYTLATLWFERRRFGPAVLAVAFSAVLVALQLGLLVGTFSIVSIPIDESSADLWVGGPDVGTVDVTFPVPERWEDRVYAAGAERVEAHCQNFAWWRKSSGGAELVVVVGAGLNEGSLGRVRQLDPHLCERLTEPGAVVVDESECERLGLSSIGDEAEVNGQPVRVVGWVQGLKGLAGPYLFCSRPTARRLIGLPPGQATYLLARCGPDSSAAEVAEKLRVNYPGELSAYTSGEFSMRSRHHWLVKTGGGIALLCAAALGLIVGAVITSQTLYAATAASLNEYAVLLALGLPRWRLTAAVLQQATCVGAAGIALAAPTVFLLAEVAKQFGASARLPTELLLAAAGVTFAMALGSGLFALRSLRGAQPACLLR